MTEHARLTSTALLAPMICKCGQRAACEQYERRSGIWRAVCRRCLKAAA